MAKPDGEYYRWRNQFPQRPDLTVAIRKAADRLMREIEGRVPEPALALCKVNMDRIRGGNETGPAAATLVTVWWIARPEDQEVPQGAIHCTMAVEGWGYKGDEWLATYYTYEDDFYYLREEAGEGYDTLIRAISKHPLVGGNTCTHPSDPIYFRDRDATLLERNRQEPDTREDKED